MSVETRIRIALVVLLVVMVAALVVFGVATRSVVEAPEAPPPEPAQSGSSVEEEMSKARQKIKDAQQEIKNTQQELEAATEARTQGTRTPKLSEEVQEACEKARLDLITGTAKGELDKDQRAALEGVIARQCE